MKNAELAVSPHPFVVFDDQPEIRKKRVRRDRARLDGSPSALRSGCHRSSLPEALELAENATFDLAIIDEESTAGRLADLVTLLRGRRPQADIVVVSRDFPATNAALASVAAPVRHLVPKPVNVHVLAAVLARARLVKP